MVLCLIMRRDAREELMVRSSRRQAPLRKDDPQQSKAFIEKARELGADADKDDDAVMRRLAKQKRRDAKPKAEGNQNH